MEVLIILGVVVAIVIFFMYASKSGAKMLAEREARLAKAENGKAKIIGSSPVGLSGTGNGGRYQAYEFALEVSNAYKEAYRTNSIWEVYPMGAPKVQEGMEVDVKIDSENDNTIFPVADGVAFSWNGLMMIMAKKMQK